ncbi:hypothetical protein E2C01_004490 [Portunus trituberculatus]|uniref:Uncharacterized protein n=1 Tax=Portunus trituberculatus TaxID=210409 RepID=A0A5B7CRI2_PORTR|nr:hypothetical protein [Portunus trituberculatus]
MMAVIIQARTMPRNAPCVLQSSKELLNLLIIKITSGCSTGEAQTLDSIFRHYHYFQKTSRSDTGFLKVFSYDSSNRIDNISSYEQEKHSSSPRPLKIVVFRVTNL